MRIGISCYASHGGSGVVATELGKHLAARGHNVAFISYAIPLRLTELPPRVTCHEVEIEEYPLLQNFPYTLALASKMAEVARMKKLQVLHIHYAIPFAAAALLAKDIVPELNLKVITTLHGTDITLVGNNASFKPVTALAIERSDAVTAVSHFLKDETYRQFAVTKKIDVIYNFIDPAEYDNPISPCIPPCDSPHQVTLMHISNFRPVKRIGDVIRIFAKVAAKIDARLLLVGDGPDVSIAAQMARDLAVVDRVIFLGVVNRVSSLLRAADLLLLPSETEGFGLVALEAMASGVPVVASDVGGLPEVIEHGSCGYLAPVGDVEQMASYALKLLSDCPLRKSFAEAGRKRAAQSFPAQQIVPQYEGIYKRVLS
ncbi:N-acetyl-alpha-D-glucosaminyl L-malate synthase BshA [Candidatus Acetothermia bacterium]|jgi:N-acetyl-alpha-D-glucosaminyl L-malate synthase BshA|nr:N-acetyl-alpha-D-glucosaminyl L-malate synthase BshA [Candidatus Acetothermia bacterium]MCI2427725.1 N-acetyl-alpha-D-glucosaminyl L-malate synthase BshA [Candidatus Acetothermia bacterium]MCI2428303.1 N-acetyl-alpha-D-glucosaminyl L-malate synthase BshA [Candidatus Acetothermia bacterium]